MRRRLEALDLNSIPAKDRQHAYHVLGLALLHEGEIEKACATFEEGLERTSGHCQLAALLALFGPRGSGGDKVDALRELQAAITDADDRLVHGDRAGVRAAIDRELVWSTKEVQSLARLAELELGDEPDSDAGKFRKALALARFLAAAREDWRFRRELPLPGASWRRERLAEVEARAQGWLDRLGGRKPRPTDSTGAPSRAPMTPLLSVETAADGSTAPALSTETAADGSTTPPLSAEPAEDGPATLLMSEETSAPGGVALPAWALALQELDGAFAALASGAALAPGRLAFRIRREDRRFAGIDVLLQKLLQNGRFSAGQVADAGDLLAASESLTDDADAAAVVAITEGALQTTRTRPAPSRTRMLRLLDALVGHPRVFLHEGPSVEVRRGELAVETVTSARGLELRFLVGGSRWRGDELLAHIDASLAVDADADARIITVVRLGGEALALARACERHRPSFPPESHDELLQRLAAVQHAIDLRVPAALAGEAREADCRPVVRITPIDEAAWIVEIGVCPVMGAGFGPPGAGSQLALGGASGLRVSTRRDFARERAGAERVAAMPALDAATRESRWRWRIHGEARLLALVEELAEREAEVVVLWPKDPWRRVGTATRKSLRLRRKRRRHGQASPVPLRL